MSDCGGVDMVEGGGGIGFDFLPGLGGSGSG